MSETIKKLILVTMIAVFAVSALSACGKKGRLENDESEYPRKYPTPATSP
ncbi:MAG: hypothetical protein K0Q70_1764 [Rhodospirillales bacterium]|nr:hypothetical protein [Rhodospirillales bacterium]